MCVFLTRTENDTHLVSMDARWRARIHRSQFYWCKIQGEGIQKYSIRTGFH